MVGSQIEWWFAESIRHFLPETAAAGRILKAAVGDGEERPSHDWPKAATIQFHSFGAGMCAFLSSRHSHLQPTGWVDAFWVQHSGLFLSDIAKHLQCRAVEDEWALLQVQGEHVSRQWGIRRRAWPQTHELSGPLHHVRPHAALVPRSPHPHGWFRSATSQLAHRGAFRPHSSEEVPARRRAHLLQGRPDIGGNTWGARPAGLCLLCFRV